MSARRTHRKSRHGCKACKQRRVKCDEQGPPCGSCEFRSIRCEYANGQQRERLPTPLHLTPPPSVEPTVSLSSTTSSLPDTSAEPARRLLELELLHQWTSSTYKSWCGTVVDEYHNWQVFVPRLALKHEYLLQGLLALAALEIADSISEDGDPSQRGLYVNAAMEYHNQASSTFRASLSNVNPTNHQPLFALSSILMVMGLILPRFTDSHDERRGGLELILTFFELIKGYVIVVHTQENALKDPLLNKYKTWDQLPINELEPDLRTSLDRLIRLNEQAHGTDHHTGNSKASVDAISRHAACRKAIFFLEEGFAKCREPDYRGYCLAWSFQSGKEFISALREKETVPLLILMHWAVLVEMISYDIWWAKDVGKDLVKDLSNVIDYQGNDDMSAGVAWARQKVGLDGSS